MWAHTVLEIYANYDDNECTWPETGEPVDWIEKGLVGYCQGEVEDLVIYVPMWQVILWKLKALMVGTWEDSRWIVYKRWRRKDEQFVFSGNFEYDSPNV